MKRHVSSDTPSVQWRTAARLIWGEETKTTATNKNICPDKSYFDSRFEMYLESEISYKEGIFYAIISLRAEMLSGFLGMRDTRHTVQPDVLLVCNCGSFYCLE